MGYFCKQLYSKELSKIAQSGHSDHLLLHKYSMARPFKMIIVQQRKEAFLKELKFEKIKFQNHLQLKMFKSVKGEMAALIPVGEIASSAESIVATSSGKQEQKN